MAPSKRPETNLDKCMAVRVRGIAAGDLPGIHEIERESFPDPWTPDVLRAEFANPLSHGVVAETPDGSMAGYCFYWTVEDEVEIHSIATAGRFRRQGVARAIMARLTQLARESGVRRILLEVRRGNTPAVALYESLGFGRDTIRKRYYADGEDAVLLSRPVTVSP